QAHIDNSYENKRALRDEIADIGRRIETADKGQENSVSFLDTKIKILENEIETGERDLAEKDGEIGKVRRELEALNFTISDMEREFYQSESRMRVLSDMQKDFDGYGVGVRHIMKSGVNGIIGTVGQLFTASDEYAPAVEVALGGAVANIVVENESIAKWAIRELKERKLGRATFLPLNSTYGNKLTGVPCEPGVLGVLSDFVQYQPEFHDIAVNLLGRTVLVDNIDNATYFSRGLGSKYRIVTLTGEIFAPGGAITGGSRGNNSGIFMRASELEALRKTMASLEAKVTLERTSRDKLAAELSEQQESLDALREDLANSKSEITLLNHKKMLLNDQIKLLEEELSRKQEVFDKFELTLKGHENAIVKLEALRVATVDKLGEIDVSCGKTSEERKKFEESIRALQDEQQGLSAAQLDLQKETTRLQGKHERAEVEKDAILLHIWEEYELTLSEMQAINEQVTTNNFGGFAPQIYFIKKLNLKEFRKKFNNSCSLFVVRCSLKDFKPQISKLKSQLKEIGNVDIEAIEKYREVSERAAFMETEREDLVASKANLEIIIEDITAQMREQFMEQFKLINAEFKVVFAKLFGGGEARLEIANNDDILESGIEITVQPPGKNVQNMMLLSGGEKALTAISLLLAIMRVRPAPFCVLDEIDAALDDINVTRFAEYLAEYAATTQFIMITHKRGTMEVSNLLYGVTMQERGVSTTIALDLDQVTVKEKDAENWTISFKTKVNTDATA
ncbi:MAG: hypothetical protein FWE47_04490, partial [Oscillospiraceae bacterium]|nr:hypothetical protein [Oscillospiraceae bacterium]